MDNRRNIQQSACAPNAEAKRRNSTKNMNIIETPTTCNHFVIRKKRFCKMTVGQGKEFCGEHEPLQPDNINCDRVPCPFDSKHSISIRKVQKHLKICNARPPVDKLSYIIPGVNNGTFDPSLETAAIPSTKLSDISSKQLSELIKKINLVYENLTIEIKKLSPRHNILYSELSNNHYGSETLKHLTQSSALLGLMEHHNFLQNDTVFVEFGAGKGQISFWLAHIIQNQLKNCKVLLIDRASHRHKKDNKIEDRKIIQRVRADIADIVLDELEQLTSAKLVIGIGKHLCGSATDLALRCLINCKNNKKCRFQPFGCLFALCCYHRCEWNTFVGKKFLLANGIGSVEFQYIVRMVSWSVCGTGRCRKGNIQIETEDETKKDRLGLTRKQREEIGWRCKRMLDAARIDFMQENGYNAHLNYYVKSDITPENVSLICVNK